MSICAARDRGILVGLMVLTVGFAAARRTLRVDDVDRLQAVDEPRVSPDGKWVAYTVEWVDAAADKQVSDVWMVSWDGTQNVRLTYGTADASASHPQWSPDGRYLTFLSSRPGPSKGKQVWALDRRGGEAFQLTNVKGELASYEWSPDSTRLALVLADRDPNEPENDKEKTGKEPPPKPVVISRYHFKEDTEGYLSGALHRIQIFEIATKKLTPLTCETK